MNVEHSIKTRIQGMSDDEAYVHLIEMQLNLMDSILEKKMDENKIVFSGVENGLLN